VLGLFPEWECSTDQRELSPGEILVLYTDGVSEAQDGAGNEFGDDRLISALRRNRELSSKPLLTTMLDEVKRFSPGEQHDDITLIVAKCR
jgi:serine phosphatase RsbU (regulator of sigma subunit)